VVTETHKKKLTAVQLKKSAFYKLKKKGGIKMGLFGGGTRTVVQSAPQQAVKDEKKDIAKKQRLVETAGGNKGQQIANNQGQSIRRVFGG
jgi:hypothetical protein